MKTKRVKSWRAVAEGYQVKAVELREQRDALKRDARIVRDYLDIGDQRLLASDGPCGNQLPDLTPQEWGEVYRACKRIAKASS
jgi:hypothetical protein